MGISAGTSGGLLDAGFFAGNYIGAVASSLTASTRADSTFYVAPVVVARSINLDRIGVEITVVGTAGALCRLGIYSTAGSIPSALVVDAGTIDGTVLGYAEKTIAVSLAPGLYWFGAGTQGGPGTAPSYRLNSGGSSYVVSSSGSASTSTLVNGYFQLPVAGALASTFAIGGTTTTSLRVVARVA